MKKSSFQYGMKFSIENDFFIPGPSLAAEKQGLGLKISIENEIFKLRMKFSSENENFVRGGMVFFMRSSEKRIFSIPRPSGLNLRKIECRDGFWVLRESGSYFLPLLRSQDLGDPCEP